MRLLEFLKDYDMSILHHPAKTNVVVDALRSLSMGSTSYVKQKIRELDRDVHRLACVGVTLMDPIEGGIVVTNVAESSLVSELKVNQDEDPIFLDIKASGHKQGVLASEQGEDDVLKYQDILCLPKVDELEQRILRETHSSRYSINPSSTKM
ncbi:uncharacterized protein [Solanum lycopersicum]|uniref:uncharacterized protein n=1 Tax=Solanum lycopersicum TaxID=4081 RepID=UPI003748D7E4